MDGSEPNPVLGAAENAPFPKCYTTPVYLGYISVVFAEYLSVNGVKNPYIHKLCIIVLSRAMQRR